MIGQIIASGVVAVVGFWGTFQLYGQVFSDAAPAEVGSVSLENTILEIKRELAEIAAVPGETAGLVLQTLTVELTTLRAKTDSSEAGLAVPIFEEASFTAESGSKLTGGSKLTVVFLPPPGKYLLASREAPSLDLSALVLATRKALLDTRPEDVDLKPKTVEIKISFVLVRSTNEGAAFKAHVIDIGGNASQVDTEANKIVLTYADPALIARDAANGAAAVPVPPK